MSFRTELERWYVNEVKAGTIEGFSVRAFNCLCRGVGRIKELNKPAFCLIAELTDEEIMSMRNVGEKTFKEITALRDIAKEQVKNFAMKEFIVWFEDSHLVITRTSSTRGTYMKKERECWIKEHADINRKGRQTISNGMGGYMGLVWAENSAEAFQTFMDILCEEES